MVPANIIVLTERFVRHCGRGWCCRLNRQRDALHRGVRNRGGLRLGAGQVHHQRARRRCDSWRTSDE